MQSPIYTILFVSVCNVRRMWVINLSIEHNRCKWIEGQTRKMCLKKTNKDESKWKAQIFEIWYKSCWFVWLPLDLVREKCQNRIKNLSFFSFKFKSMSMSLITDSHSIRARKHHRIIIQTITNKLNANRFLISNFKQFNWMAFLPPFKMAVLD